ncbi:hypothetical protein FACS189437_08170 [Bacteroidia bacterium]|nr:hypothetical protein FACS189437_08170 [Bacteroidia bacterium]
MKYKEKFSDTINFKNTQTMGTTNFSREWALIALLVVGITTANAQSLKVNQNGSIDIKAKTIIHDLNADDGFAVVTRNSTTVLGSDNDLIWGGFYQAQPSNPGIFGLMSVSAAIGWKDCFTVLANGNTGIFNDHPSVALEIGEAGNARQVKVNGNIVWGSDERMKANIKDISNSLSLLKQLRSVSYNLKDEEKEQTIPEKFLNDKDLDIETMKAELKKASKTNKYLLSRNFYGFLAQEVQKIFPDLVYSDSAGMLSVDYIGIIPLLVDGFKEQQNQIDNLRLEVEKLKGNTISEVALRSTTQETATTGISNPVIAQCKLYQNVPNPFTGQTEIKYMVASGAKNAYICIFDMQGKMLQKLDAKEGQNSVYLEGAKLQAGMYLYSLIVDGQEVDTKRMILTK